MLDHNEKISKKYKKSRHNAGKNKHQQDIVREERKKVHDLDKSLEHRWTNFTQVFGYNIGNKQFKIENIALGVQNFAVVVAYRNEIAYPLRIKHNKKYGVKLMEIEKVIHKLMKSKTHIIENFTIIYQDRFEGNLECDLKYFIEETDIPLHRVQMVKENNQIVWDRQNKIDLLKLA